MIGRIRYSGGIATKYGIKTIIAERLLQLLNGYMLNIVMPHILSEMAVRQSSSISGSCSTGGFPGLCLDWDEYRELAGKFLKALASRYKDHPGVLGYDIWNECNYGEDVCYCPAPRKNSESGFIKNMAA
jgi:beta-galactosidase